MRSVLKETHIRGWTAPVRQKENIRSRAKNEQILKNNKGKRKTKKGGGRVKMETGAAVSAQRMGEKGNLKRKASTEG